MIFFLVVLNLMLINNSMAINTIEDENEYQSAVEPFISFDMDDTMEADLILAQAGEGGTPPQNQELSVSDPLEPFNRLMFNFNDKFYFWFLKPVSRAYRAVVPNGVRVGVSNMFYNFLYPIRLINCIFQGKFRGAWDETVRFMVNTTAGMGGVVDVVKHSPYLKDMEIHDEDLGQSFAVWGMGPGPYIVWPILGPSSVRDTFGLIGDAFIDPVNYAFPRTKYNLSVRGYRGINKTSLTIGEYEDLKRSALDPYIAVRDAYFQYRRSLIKK